MSRQPPKQAANSNEREVDGSPSQGHGGPSLRQRQRQRQQRIAALAGRQKGNVGRGQLLALGIAGHTVDNWVGTGRLIPRFRGVYRLGHEAVPEFSDELAAVMACGRAALLGEHSACFLWRLLSASDSSAPVSSAPVSVLVVGRDLRSRPGIRVRRIESLPRAERTVNEGIPVTTPARTILDLAAIADTRTLEDALNEAQASRLATPSVLSRLIARHPRHRGSRRLRALIEGSSDGFTRSEAERQLLRLIRIAQLPLPRGNARVGGYEVDFVWPQQRLVVEVDGFRFHGSRVAFERDRRRDGKLAALGYAVIRVTWRQIVDEPHAVVARIAQAVARR